MRQVLVGLIVSLWLSTVPGCAPSVQHSADDWDSPKITEPEITGDNEKDEARWRRELESDPLGKDGHLLTDDPPKALNEDEEAGDIPPDFMGPPAPLTGWDSFKHGAAKFGKLAFSALTVVFTLGMMAAPYLMMI